MLTVWKGIVKKEKNKKALIKQSTMRDKNDKVIEQTSNGTK